MDNPTCTKHNARKHYDGNRWRCAECNRENVRKHKAAKRRGARLCRVHRVEMKQVGAKGSPYICPECRLVNSYRVQNGAEIKSR